jgi:hypothetical protein
MLLEFPNLSTCRATLTVQNGASSRESPHVCFVRSGSWRRAVPRIGAPRRVHKEVRAFLLRKFPEKCNWHERTYQLASPFAWPYSPWLSNFGVHQGCCVGATVGRNILGGWEIRWLPLPLPHLTCGLKLNTDTMSAWSRTVPSLNTCKMQVTKHVNITCLSAFAFHSCAF